MTGSERIAISGKNGSGKTTLIKLILGKLEPTEGAVRVGVCVNVTEVSPNLLRTFGFDTTNVTIEMFTTYPYEL